MKIGVLYIDDEISNLISFNAIFREYYKIFTASSATEGQIILEKHNKEIQIIITDQRMPGMTGVEFLASIIDKFPEPIRILLTGYSDIQAVIDAVNKGQIYHYLSKPWNEENLKMVIDKAFELFALRDENKKLTKDLATANGQLEFLLRQKLLS